MKKAALHNLGCKVNAYETEAMQEMLEQAGYEIVPFKEGADVYVINTCTVTNIADRKSRQMLHRARKLNPEAVVVAAGCYVQAQDGKEHDPCIDIVIGNNHKKDLVRILGEYEAGRVKRREDQRGKAQEEGHAASGDRYTAWEIEDINRTKEYEALRLTRTGEHTRAYIKVQDGCNQFCTYCIIPYARGRVRSRDMQDVAEEVRRLAEKGYREVVLTGIHLSSYGIDFDGQRHLLDLIRVVHETEGIMRIYDDPDHSIVVISKSGERREYDVDSIQTNDNQTKSGVIDLFMESIVKEVEPEISGESVLNAMKAVFASIESSEKGCTVSWKEDI